MRTTRRFSIPSAKMRTGVSKRLELRSVCVLLESVDPVFAFRLLFCAVFRFEEETVLSVSVRMVPVEVSMVWVAPCVL